MQQKARKNAGNSHLAERLEDRQLLSVTVSDNGGVLSVAENANNDVATITVNAANGNSFSVTGTGLSPQQFSSITTITVAGSNLSSNQSVTFGNTGANAISLSGALTVSNVAAVNFLETTSFSTASIQSGGGQVTIAGPNITTTGDQNYGGPVALSSDLTLAATSNGNITFSSTLDGAHAVSTSTGGATTFGGPVGGITALTALATGAGGALTINSIATSGAQTFNNAVNVGSDATLTSTAGGNIIFNNTVGSSSYSKLTINTAGMTRFAGAVGKTPGVLKALTIGTGGPTVIAGGAVYADNQSFSNAVTLTADTTFETAVGSALQGVAFHSTVDGPYALEWNSYLFLYAAVGAIKPLASVQSTGTFAGTMIAKAPVTVTTTGAQLYSGGIGLNAPATLTSLSSGNITASYTDGPEGLAITTAGHVLFTNSLGQGTPLASLSIGSGGSVEFGGGVGEIRTSGSQAYHEPASFDADSDTAIQATSGGSITFESSVNALGLIVGTTGLTKFVGPVQAQISSSGPTEFLTIVVQASAGAASISLSEDADHQHIDWTVGTSSSQMLISDSFGLTIDGNPSTDSVFLNYTNGNPLPNIVHLNGTFTINGLQGTNPLAGTTLEVGRSTVFISYGSSDPIAAIQSYLQAGYNAGGWNGAPTAATGVITSAAAAANPNHNTAIGYADWADGQGVNTMPNTIELTYTLYGDANLDHQVNSADLQILLAAFNTSGAWDRGDFNYDGIVNSADLQALLATFNTQLGSQATPMAIAGAPAIATSAPSSGRDTSPALMPAINAAGSATPTLLHLHPAKAAARKRR
jgi:hypothetical protein